MLTHRIKDTVDYFFDYANDALFRCVFACWRFGFVLYQQKLPLSAIGDFLNLESNIINSSSTSTVYCSGIELVYFAVIMYVGMNGIFVSRVRLFLN